MHASAMSVFQTIKKGIISGGSNDGSGTGGCDTGEDGGVDLINESINL